MTSDEPQPRVFDTDGDAAPDVPGDASYRYRTREGEPPSEAVVFAVAAVADSSESPLTLSPLYEVIDPDALDRLCGGDDATGVCVEFDYEGHHVVVDRGGDEITVRELGPAGG